MFLFLLVVNFLRGIFSLVLTRDSYSGLLIFISYGETDVLGRLADNHIIFTFPVGRNS